MMLAPLKYARDKFIQLPDSVSDKVQTIGVLATESVADPRTAIQEMLATPIHFPPLQKAFVPGDQIVIAVGSHLPRCAQLIAGILDYLVNVGVEANQICILRTQHDANRNVDPLGEWDDIEKNKIDVVTHNPANRDEMGYLAADEFAEPIYFNRHLIDADFIIPLVCTEPHNNQNVDSVPDNTAIHIDQHSQNKGLLFPTFADEKSQQRFAGKGEPKKTVKSKLGKSASKSAKKSVEQSDESMYRDPPDSQLGLFFSIQIVPGAEDQIAKIFAGDSATLIRQANELCQQLWTATIERPVDLIIAALAPTTEQTWESISETLVRLLPLLRANGSLVLCNSLNIKPPEVYQQWAAANMPDDVLDQIRDNNITGWQVVHRVHQAREHARLFMLSELPPSMIDDLGWAAITHTDELVRLVQQSTKTLVIHHADRVQVRIAPSTKQ